MAYTFILLSSSDSLLLALHELKFVIGNKPQTSDALCVPVIGCRSIGQSCVYSGIFPISFSALFGKQH